MPEQTPLPRRRAAVIWTWVFVLAWMILIYWLSSQSGLQTVPLVRRLGLLPPGTALPYERVLELVLRKTAHMIAYAVLAAAVYRAQCRTWPEHPAARQRWQAFFFAVAYAVTDEWHQTWVPGRDGRFIDILIDAAGAGAGLGLAAAAARGRLRRVIGGRRHLLHLGLGLSGISLANRLASYGREAGLAAFLGPSLAADQYAVAYTASLLLGSVLGGAFGIVTVPKLVQAGTDLARQRRLLGDMAGALLLTAGPLTAVLLLPVWQPAAWHSLGAAGRWNWGAFALALPICALFVFYGYVLNAHDHFVLPLALPILSDGILLATAVLGAGVLGVSGSGVGHLIGFTLILALATIALAHYRAAVPPRLGGWRRAPWQQLWPAVLTALAPGLLPLLGQALAVPLAPGDASVLHYAWMVTGLPAGILAQPAAVVLLPYLSRSAGAPDGFRAQAAGGLAALLAFLIPAAVGLSVLARPISNLLFGYGAFGPGGAARLAAALVALAPGAVGTGLAGVAQQAWYARGNTGTPWRWTFAGLGLGLALGLALRPLYGYLGLALGMSAGAVFTGLALLWRLHKEIGLIDGFMARLLAWAAAGSALMGAAVAGWQWLAPGLPVVAVHPHLVQTVGGIGLGAAVYAAVMLGWLRQAGRLKGPLKGPL